MNGNRPKQDPPRSMSNLYSSVPNDIGALSERQQAALNLVKTQTRKTNELYLRNHPEVSIMINSLVRYCYCAFYS
ncbi:unnamed protein product [Hymenolepis diminuta]|uniref:Uncharacterized protein n=1 Tax=Hymenolepis diminuta TaxID=6216 RepID=A0A564YTR2_HYMDI|nr:unnamed protein product [Hymenolepis diminuta]